MRKYFIFLLTAVSLFTLSGLMSEPAASRDRSILPAPTATPADASPLLVLDKREVLTPCEPGYRCVEDCDGDMTIVVKAQAVSPAQRKNVYKYSVSGGSVIGEGKNVIWNLSNTKPGTYHITVTVSDGNQTKEATETIVVRNCTPTCGLCDCPEISVSGSQSVEAGEIVTFKANVSGGTGGDINYKWTVSQGEIIDGQETPEITVLTSREMMGSVKATVEILGLCLDCVKTASAEAQITK